MTQAGKEEIIVKQNTFEAIKLIEQITASRYYSERARTALIDTVATALFLSAEEKDKVLAAQQTQYTQLQEVRNALLLLVGTHYSEEAEAVLKARLDVLNAQIRLPYYDRSTWLVYVRQCDKSHGDAEQFEAACFATATNHMGDALDKYVRLAHNGNLSALWMAVGIARKLGNEEEEGRLLGEVNILWMDGVLDYLPDEVQARIAELTAAGYECNATVDYTPNKIGF